MNENGALNAAHGKRDRRTKNQRSVREENIAAMTIYWYEDRTIDSSCADISLSSCLTFVVFVFLSSELFAVFSVICWNIFKAKWIEKMILRFQRYNHS